MINGRDPFAGCPEGPSGAVPPVEASDLVSYLVLQTSFISPKQFKARKSLEAYNQFVCGWVKDVRMWKTAGKYLTTGRVSVICTLRFHIINGRLACSTFSASFPGPTLTTLQ